MKFSLILIFLISIIFIAESATILDWTRQNREWQDNQEPFYYSGPSIELLNNPNDNNNNNDMGYFYYYYFIPYNQNTNLKVAPVNVIQNTNTQGTLNTDTQYYLIQNEAIQYPNIQLYLTPNNLIPTYVYNWAAYSQRCDLYPWSSYCILYNTVTSTKSTTTVEPRLSSRIVTWLFKAGKNPVTTKSSQKS
jgi:hypothetical protein